MTNGSVLKKFHRRPKVYAGEAVGLSGTLGPPYRVSPEAAKALGLVLGDAVSLTVRYGDGCMTAYAQGDPAGKLDSLEDWTDGQVHGTLIYGEYEDFSTGEKEAYYGLLISDVTLDGEPMEYFYPDGLK